MKKIVLSIVAVSSLVYSAQLGIDAGWSMVGFSESISPKSVFNNVGVNSVWRYNTADGKWEFYSPNTQLQALATSAGYNALSEYLNNYTGVWVQANASLSVETASTPVDSVFYPSIIKKYDNKHFGIQINLGKFSFGTSDNGINWSELYSKNITNTNSYYKGLMVHSDTRADVFFDNREVNASGTVYSAYGLIYNNGVVTQKLLDQNFNTNNTLVSGQLFGKKEDNTTSIALLESFPYARTGNTLKIYESSANDWVLKNTISGYNNNNDNNPYINIVNYDLTPQYNISNENIGVKYILNSFATSDSVSNKTNFYGTANNYALLFSLDGIWTQMTSHSGVDGFVVLGSQDGYGGRGTSLAIVQNKDYAVVESKFEHIPRTVGTLYHYDQNSSLQTQDFYVFTHDKVGGDLNIYTLATDGSTQLVKTVANFNYAIKQIYGMSYNPTTENIECTLYVNDYNTQIKSIDSFATWTPVVSNYRPNTTESTENPEDKNWIKIQNQDGSFTLIRKQ